MFKTSDNCQLLMHYFFDLIDLTGALTVRNKIIYSSRTHSQLSQAMSELAGKVLYVVSIILYDYILNI